MIFSGIFLNRKMGHYPNMESGLCKATRNDFKGGALSKTRKR